jgi:hypothetical protein
MFGPPNHVTAIGLYLDSRRYTIFRRPQSWHLPKDEMPAVTPRLVGAGLRQSVAVFSKPLVAASPWINVNHSDVVDGAGRNADQCRSIAWPHP